MSCKKGDIILINFPFTNLQKSKKRPVILVKDANELGDFVCFQITSKATQNTLRSLDANDLKEGELKLRSFVNYDKCFTLNAEIVDRKLASASDAFMNELKTLFCQELF